MNEINGSDLASKMMTHEGFSKIEREKPWAEDPYVYEVNIGGCSLTYFGTGHSFDPESPMYQQMIKKFEELKPDLVLIEGYDNFKEAKIEGIEFIEGKTQEEIIRQRGEPTLMLSLAIKNNIDVDSPEPKFSDEVNNLIEKGFSEEQIFVFYITRALGQYYRVKDKPEIERYLERHINDLKEEAPWKDFDYSFENYKKLYHKLFGKEFSAQDLSSFDGLADPIPWEGKEMKFSNNIAVASSNFRDTSILSHIREKVKTYKNIFIVYGATHAVMQEPALRYLAQQIG